MTILGVRALAPILMAVLTLGLSAKAAFSGESWREACGNEAGLLCPGVAEAALRDCLLRNSTDLLNACKAALAPLEPGGVAQRPAEVTPDAPAAAPGQLVVKTERDYEIRGATEEELVKQMEALGPVDPRTGRRVRSRTAFGLRWSHTCDYRDIRPDGTRIIRNGRVILVPNGRMIGGWAVADAGVEVSMTSTFPRWTDSARAPAALRERWAAYLEALKAYEAPHRKTAISFASRTLDKIKKLHSSDCKSLIVKVDEVGHAYAKEIQVQIQKDNAGEQGKKLRAAALFP